MIKSIFDLEKNRNMLWNQGSQLFHLPHETEFFHEIFIFSTSLRGIPASRDFQIIEGEILFQKLEKIFDSNPKLLPPLTPPQVTPPYPPFQSLGRGNVPFPPPLPTPMFMYACLVH